MGLPVNLLIGSLAILICLQHVKALNCITCENCEILEGAEGAESKACKANQNKCIKMMLMSGEVDRMCGDSKKCAGREGGRKSRAVSKPEEFTNNTPKHRTIRQLLGVSGAGGGAGADTSKDLAAMYCCGEDDCNGSPISNKLAIIPAIIGLFLVLRVL